MSFDEALLAEWVERLRRLEPNAVAVLLTGSHAQGRAGPHSDVDLTVLTSESPRVEYPVFLQRLPNGRLLHVSVACTSLEDWLLDAEEPADWSFYFPVELVERLLWATPEVENLVKRRGTRQPPGGMELEDFVSCACKLKAARAQGDELALRLSAHDLAAYCPSILLRLNPERRVRHRYEALLAALELPHHPPGYREDMLVCLGLTGARTTAEDVYAAAMRLTLGTLELLRPHSTQLAAEMQPDLDRYLADGTLLEFVQQDGDASN